MDRGSPEDKFSWTWTTAWGPMGAVAGDAGLRRVVLPHYGMEDLEQLIAWEHPQAVRGESAFSLLVQLSREYFNGRPVEFAGVACDLPGGFTGMVLRACREIPYGQTKSYGALAVAIGQPDASRAVAAALGRNPAPLVVPCHRVMYADGRLGGFSAPGGAKLKGRMLALEKQTAGVGQ